jgi:hypothetical protein
MNNDERKVTRESTWKKNNRTTGNSKYLLIIEMNIRGLNSSKDTS